MHATVRRYEGVEVTRRNEVTGKLDGTPVPQRRTSPGFRHSYLIGLCGRGSWAPITAARELAQRDLRTPQE